MKSLYNAATAMIFGSLLALFAAQSVYADQDNYVKVGGIVSHIGSDGYTDEHGSQQSWNERKNHIFGLEIVDKETQVGLGAMRFSNSYGNEGGLVYGSKYWKLNESVKVGVLAGVTYGYEDNQMNSRLRIGNKMHMMLAPTIKVESEGAFSQVSAYGNAVVMTVGFKF